MPIKQFLMEHEIQGTNVIMIIHSSNITVHKELYVFSQRPKRSQV